jgi:hypothetical protein
MASYSLIPTGARDDRILRETRWLGWIIIPFLAVAFVILYLFPGRTKDLFAWNIQPAMSAMLLGAAYLGGIVFFWQVARGSRWSAVTVGFPAVTTFATLMGIATILHWDRFLHGTLAFTVWAILYFVTPFLVLLVWVRNRATDPGTQSDDLLLSLTAKRLFMGSGAVTLLIGVALFLFPSLMASVWAWTLTPLTARVVAAMFALAGVEQLGIAIDARWRAAEALLLSQMVSLVFILLATFICWNQFIPGRLMGWIFLVGITTLLVSIAWYYLAMRQRTGAAPAFSAQRSS